MNPEAYVVRRVSRSHFFKVRGMRYHALVWGDASQVTPERPTLVMLHGWMDVAASFQFVVDALSRDRHVIALDWRGFGLTDSPPIDTYWMPDYLGDLDAALDALLPGQVVDLLGHSMGGNVAMMYGGIRPERIRRLVNLEGFGMPASRPSQAPKRYALWLDELKTPTELRPYASLGAVAERLRKTNPLLPEHRALWLAQHWSRQRLNADGTPETPGVWDILADSAHKRVNPTLYQVPEALECWGLISAPVLWVEGDRSDLTPWWGTRYSKPEFHERISVVRNVEKQLLSPAGHMLHHDQPEALARHLESFLG